MYILVRCIGFVISLTILLLSPPLVIKVLVLSQVSDWTCIVYIDFLIFLTILLLAPPLFIKVPVLSLSDSRTCMRVMCIDCFDDFVIRWWS